MERIEPARDKRSPLSKRAALLASVLTATAFALTAGPAGAQLVISELDLAGDRVELVNIGPSTVDATLWWVCNRVNGPPGFYDPISTLAIDMQLSTGTSYDVAPGEILVIDVTGYLPDANGEFALYNTNSFLSAAAIEDYVAYGGNGTRDSVAQTAGIWTNDTFVAIAGIGAGETIQLELDQFGDAADEYFVGDGTLGVAQSVPEPGATLAGAACLLALGCLRRVRA